jgi:hypothetical protein
MMKNQKINGGSGPKAPSKAGGSAPKAAKPAAVAKPDPRAVPAPTAPASVAVRAAAAIAAVPAVAEAAPKKAEAKPEPRRIEPVKAALPKAAPKPVAAVSRPVPVAAKPAPAPIADPRPAAAVSKASGVVPQGGIVPSAEKAIAPLATALEVGADQARAAYARVQDTGENLRQAVQRSSAATTRGMVEINGKVLDLIRAQNEATIDLWRSTLTAPSLSEAVRAHTSGLRHAYEATATQWKEIAETAGRVMGEAAKPLQSAFVQGR